MEEFWARHSTFVIVFFVFWALFWVLKYLAKDESYTVIPLLSGPMTAIVGLVVWGLMGMDSSIAFVPYIVLVIFVGSTLWGLYRGVLVRR